MKPIAIILYIQKYTFVIIQISVEIHVCRSFFCGKTITMPSFRQLLEEQLPALVFKYPICILVYAYICNSVPYLNLLQRFTINFASQSLCTPFHFSCQCGIRNVLLFSYHETENNIIFFVVRVNWFSLENVA